MSYLSDEQIKILLVSKESPTICDTVRQEDYDVRCLDQLIKSSSDFDHFSLCLTFYCNNVTQNKIENIIKSKLGQDGLKELNSALNVWGEYIKNDQLADQYMQEERNTTNNEPTDVFKYNTPEEDRGDWDHY